MPPRKLNIVESAEQQITALFDPHIVGDVNDAQVKVAKFGAEFDWHSHQEEDEAFLVLKGRIAIDFRDGTIELEEGDFIVVPRKVEHRPRSLSEAPIVLMIEPATTLNTGDAESAYTVKDPNYLLPT